MKLNLDATNFLQQYWQKQPKVFRNAFDAFADPLDEHDLAGLSELEDVDSRIVSLKNQQWHVFHGPFDDFNDVCQGDWSLLVQGVNQYSDDAHALLNLFNFIPNWRLDDLMVSFSVENAGVGPHLDQYDVFIIQGKGSRRWQVGARNQPDNPYPTLRPHPDLGQIESFSPIIDEILLPGDMIYIPPGFPHNGIALENCLNYSVGFRAPEQMQLWENLLQHYHDEALSTDRYTDVNLTPRQYSAEITKNELASLQALMQNMIQNMAHNPSLIKWFMSYNTLQGEEALLTQDELSDTTSEETETVWQALQNHDVLTQNPGTRTLFYSSGSHHYFAVNGYVRDIPNDSITQPELDVLKQWLSHRELSTELLRTVQSDAIKQFIATVITEQWYEF